jgi:hypothetical protein
LDISTISGAWKERHRLQHAILRDLQREAFRKMQQALQKELYTNSLLRTSGRSLNAEKRVRP